MHLRKHKNYAGCLVKTVGGSLMLDIIAEYVDKLRKKQRQEAREHRRDRRKVYRRSHAVRRADRDRARRAEQKSRKSVTNDCIAVFVYSRIHGDRLSGLQRAVIVS